MTTQTILVTVSFRDDYDDPSIYGPFPTPADAQAFIDHWATRQCLSPDEYVIYDQVGGEEPGGPDDPGTYFTILTPTAPSAVS